MTVDVLSLIARWSASPFRRALDDVKRGVLPRLVRDERGFVDLRGADLRGAELAGLDLRHARLDFANLESATLDGADCTSATMTFVRAVESRWSAASLRFADLSCANFSGANMTSSSLRDGILSNAIFAGADLRAADLRGAFLRFCDLETCLISGARLNTPDDSGLTGIAAAARFGWGFRRAPSAKHLRTAEGIAWGAVNLDVVLAAALASDDWRTHIVAATVACAGANRLRVSQRLVAELWDAATRSSMGAQLVAACFLLDEEFFEHASANRKLLTQDARSIVELLAAHAVVDGLRNDGISWLLSVQSGASAPARASWARQLEVS